MDANAGSIDRTVHTAPGASPRTPGAGVIAVSMQFVSIMFAAAAGLFLWRRLSGAFLNPVPASSLLVTGLMLCTIAISLQEALRRCRLGNTQRLETTLGLWLPGISLFGLTTALSVPGTSTSGLIALWLPAIATEATWLAFYLRLPTSTEMETKSTSTRIIRFDPPQKPAPHFPAEDVSQQLTRTRTPEGQDLCHGWVRADFESRQRTETIHLAFCPPFATVPELSTTLEDGPGLQIKQAQLMPYGARLELRLDRAQDIPASTLLRFSAVEAKAPAAEAAPPNKKGK